MPIALPPVVRETVRSLRLATLRHARRAAALEFETAMGFKTILVPVEQHDLMNSTLETALLLA